MTRPVLITAALTGADDTTSRNPAVPVTPEEIADEAVAAAKAGAAIVHIHVRDPGTRGPSRDPALYRETVERIRTSGIDVILNLTTGPGARFIPDTENPSIGGTGTTLATPEDRVAHILELKPEICTLDIATFNFGEHAFVNIPRDLRRMGELVRNAGVRPELEVFDLGHIRLATHLIEQGVIETPALFQLCLGIPWGAPATPAAMMAMHAALPDNAVWAGFGISRQEFEMVAQAVVLGGHVRVGLEDNLWLGPGELAPSNAALVARAARIVTDLGHRVASPGEARELLNLSSR